MSNAKILIVDDDPLVADSLSGLSPEEPGLRDVDVETDSQKRA